MEKPKLLDQLRIVIRTLHYSIRTEDAYADWARRFILFHGMQHPASMGAPQVEVFLSHLAVERRVSASTQNQAKAALLFLYKRVLKIELPWMDDVVSDVVSAKASLRLPVVLTQREVREMLLNTSGTMWLVCSLLYGTGMRLLECLRLRVKDIEFARREIVVKESGKAMQILPVANGARVAIGTVEGVPVGSAAAVFVESNGAATLGTAIVKTEIKGTKIVQSIADFVAIKPK